MFVVFQWVNGAKLMCIILFPVISLLIMICEIVNNFVNKTMLFVDNV